MKDPTNPLGDDRFAAMFSNAKFQVDEESEVSHYYALHHHLPS